jgi:hypothetical protein
MKKLKQYLFDAYCIWDNPLTQIIILIATVIVVILLLSGKL